MKKEGVVMESVSFAVPSPFLDRKAYLELVLHPYILPLVTEICHICKSFFVFE